MTTDTSLIRKDDDESGWAQIFYSSRQGDNSKDDEYEEATFEGRFCDVDMYNQPITK